MARLQSAFISVAVGMFSILCAEMLKTHGLSAGFGCWGSQCWFRAEGGSARELRRGTPWKMLESVV